MGNAEMEEGAKIVGIGSMAWLLQENGISNTEEMLAFISHPSRQQLLEGFYQTLAPEIADEVRRAVEKRQSSR